MRYCDRCRISYAETYSRPRCEECGGVVAPWPDGRAPRWLEVRRAGLVPQEAYHSRVQHRNGRIAVAAARARARFEARLGSEGARPHRSRIPG
jgi:hypothetical protein